MALSILRQPSSQQKHISEKSICIDSGRVYYPVSVAADANNKPNSIRTMKTETWEIWNGNEMKKIRVKGATQHIWNVVNVPITKAVAKKLGTLEGWKAQIRHSPRIIFSVD